eukprot:5779592-Alexandrium_andersonii.AAC.1
MRDIQEETGIELDLVHATVYHDVGWSFLHEMYRSAWAKHAHYPEHRLRPTMRYHKRVRYYMAEAS